jgi:hypothetical protein
MHKEAKGEAGQDPESNGQLSLLHDTEPWSASGRLDGKSSGLPRFNAAREADNRNACGLQRSAPSDGVRRAPTASAVDDDGLTCGGTERRRVEPREGQQAGPGDSFLRMFIGFADIDEDRGSGSEGIRNGSRQGVGASAQAVRAV